MLDSLYIAITGMHSQQSNIQSISNNLANMNTTAYKRSRVSFDDLMYQPMPGVTSTLSQQDGIQNVGMGTQLSSMRKDFTVGDLVVTDNSLDLAIRGNGFFEVNLPNGEKAYTRSGALTVNEEGYLSTQQGYVLSNQIQVSPDALEVRVTKDGRVMVRTDNEEPYEAGQIELANFVAPSQLSPEGNNIYLATEKAGEPFFDAPGSNGLGEIQQGALEGSNVDLVKELIDLVIAQRGYSVNSQIIRASDEMLKINNNLR